MLIFNQKIGDRLWVFQFLSSLNYADISSSVSIRITQLYGDAMR